MEEELKYILLENFETLSGTKVNKINLSYQVFGKKLGSAPVILVNHALTGNSLVSGINGWWSEIIGNEKPINTNNHLVAKKWSLGTGFYTNDLRLDSDSDSNGLTIGILKLF